MVFASNPADELVASADLTFVVDAAWRTEEVEVPLGRQ